MTTSIITKSRYLHAVVVISCNTIIRVTVGMYVCVCVCLCVMWCSGVGTGGGGKGGGEKSNSSCYVASNTFVAHEIHVRSSHMELPIPTFGNINITRLGTSCHAI